MNEWIQLTKALSDHNRVRVLGVLRGRELCACRIIEMLDVAPSTVSAHMAILQRVGLVTVRKEGRWRHYRLAGKSSSPLARRFLGFLQKTLHDDTTILEDRQHMADVMARETATCV